MDHGVALLMNWSAQWPQHLMQQGNIILCRASVAWGGFSRSNSFQHWDLPACRHDVGVLCVQTPEKDEYSRTRQQMTAHIDVCMGGRVAEELIFGEEQVLSSVAADVGGVKESKHGGQEHAQSLH